MSQEGSVRGGEGNPESISKKDEVFPRRTELGVVSLSV